MMSSILLGLIAFDNSLRITLTKGSVFDNNRNKQSGKADYTVH